MITQARNGVVLMDDMTLFNRIVDAIAADYELTRERAGRILDQAVIFVHFAGNNPGRGYCPSPDVDKGWDKWVTYTMAYTAWCEKNAGRYVHHAPIDDPENPPQTIDGRPLVRPYETANLLRETGYVVDDELWPDTEAKSKANCTNCYSGDHEGGSGP